MQNTATATTPHTPAPMGPQTLKLAHQTLGQVLARVHALRTVAPVLAATGLAKHPAMASMGLQGWALAYHTPAQASTVARWLGCVGYSCLAVGATVHGQWPVGGVP